MLLLRLPLHWPRRQPQAPQCILVLHHLLLGDAIMLGGLLAKLRQQYPDAKLYLATPEATVSLFAGNPYGVQALAFNPRCLATLLALFRLPRPDLAIIPAENRYTPLAGALGARWIVAFEGDSPAWKNWLVDDLRSYPPSATAWPDMATMLIDGPPPAPFKTIDWPAPPHREFPLPGKPFCVLHLGASSSLRHWSPENWSHLAGSLTARGYTVVWSGGPGEEYLVRQCDPAGSYISYAGRLDLSQMWHLLANASLLVSPDTGIAHLVKATGTPSVTLFGPGSALIYGPGEFWSEHLYRAITIDSFPCRDGHMLFERTFISWVRHCARPPSECPAPRCMQGLTPSMVEEACYALLSHAKNAPTDCTA